MKSIGGLRSPVVLALGAALLAPPAGARDTGTPGSESASHAEYVGSTECAGCHTQIYERWWATRHAYSVLTADEARAAGYPLPAQGNEAGRIQGWRDVSYVVGGRQRIAYAFGRD